MTVDTKCAPLCGPTVAPPAPPVAPPYCPECPPATNTVVGIDCDGAPVTVTGPGVVASVQPAGSVYMVKQCPGAVDREIAIYCDKNTGAPVVQVMVLPVDAPIGTVPVFEYYSAGAVWAGDPATELVSCGLEKFDTAPVVWFCETATQNSISRIDIVDISTTPATVSYSLWQDASGAVIAAPAAGTYTVGACALSQYDAEESVVCSAGVNLTRVRFYDRVTRALAAVEYRDQNNVVVAQTAAEIAAHTEGACALLDVETAQRCYRVIAATPYAAIGDVIKMDTIILVSPVTGQYDLALSKNIWSNQSQDTTVGITLLDGTQVMGVTPDLATEVVPCEAYVVPPLLVTGGAAQIAGPTRALTAAFAGAVDNWDTSAVGGALQSVTIAARGVTDGLPGNTVNQVVVDAPDGTKHAMMNGETRTWSVVRDQDGSLTRDYRATATGNAYANITYTFV